AERKQGAREAGGGNGVAGMHRQGAAQACKRVVRAALSLPHHAQVDIGIGVLRSLRGDTLEPAAGIVELIASEAHDAEIEHRIRMPRLPGKYGLEFAARRR